MLSRFAKAFLAVIVALLLLTTIATFHTPTRAYIDPWTGQIFGEGGAEKTLAQNSQSHANAAPATDVTKGGVIMSRLGNETAKVELGRATWKLMHTMTLRFPEKPTPDEREAIRSYFHLTSRLYPCGECAHEFQQLLKTYPPQTSSRMTVALWLCSIHNRVNERLKKPQFDCANLDSTYDCGCGDPPLKQSSHPDPMDLERDPTKDQITGAGLIKGG